MFELEKAINCKSCGYSSYLPVLCVGWYSNIILFAHSAKVSLVGGNGVINN